jgi:hypothetical protein
MMTICPTCLAADRALNDAAVTHNAMSSAAEDAELIARFIRTLKEKSLLEDEHIIGEITLQWMQHITGDHARQIIEYAAEDDCEETSE